ncbi:MAG: sulfite exporter TauE/SafE family protein [Calditrichaeota bacterium]|nr:MAG: sulfite exporter TauE/SafE family protein [Calditrichota bacterium]
MDSYYIALSSAAWLGILTSLSPCPLATNITAISFISKQVASPRKVLLSGFLYILGRILTYTILGIIVVSSMLSIPDVALFLQKNMNKALGPILIVVGIFLFDFVKIKIPGIGVTQNTKKRVENSGVWGAGILGFLFALSFCPVSAALFFGSLIPLAINHQSSVLMPTVYGIGTGLPVVIFAVLITFGAKWVGNAFNKLAVFEKWARRITASVFIAAGVYYTLIYIFNINL